MASRKPSFDLLSEDNRQRCIESIVAYFVDERDEEIGVITAEEILDLVQAQITKDAYNRGVSDASKLVQDRTADINVELNLLLRTN